MKKTTIATRLISGFGILTLLVAILGGGAYYMFIRVDGEVGSLSRHSLPAVQHATGVERNAFECIMEERNYVLYQKDETHKKAREKIAELMDNLDKVDKVANQFNDKALDAKSKEVRKIVKQWADLYDKGVEAFVTNQAAGHEMYIKGVAVSTEASDYMKAKNAEYNEAKTALAIVNRITALAFETRMDSKAYMLYKQEKFFDAVSKNIASLLGCYDELEKLHPDATEKKQIADARKATQDYFADAQKWVEAHKATLVAEQEMTKKYDVVMKAYTDFNADQEKDLSSSTNDVVRNQKTQMLAIGGTISDYVNAAVIASKDYMLDNKPEYWKGVTNQIDGLLKVYASLRKLADNDRDRQQIDLAEKATQDYLVAAKSWVEKDIQLDAADAAMTVGGETVVAAAKSYATAKSARTDKNAESVFIVSDIAYTAVDVRRAARTYMHTQDPAEWIAVTNGIATLNKLYAELRKVSLTDADMQRIDRAEKATAEYLVAANTWVRNDTDLRQNILPEMRKIGAAVLSTAQSAESDAWKASDQSSVTVGDIVSASKTLALGMLLAGLVVGVLSASLITRSITKAIKTIADALIRGADQTYSAASQVASSSQGFAEGSSEQASSIEETSASLEEMSSMTKRNAESAKNANELAKAARVAAEKGVKDMEAMNEAMQAIKSAGDGTAKIIKTIDEIAFQTNILALNAAVEAARAGEAGMGFAVVAEEVRNLAQRSAQSAKETAEKIESSISSTNQGVELTSKVSATLNEIVAKVRQVDELAAEVASASMEQTQGIAQVNAAVSEMDKVVQSNAAGAEESAAAAQELNTQAGIMKSSVGELLQLVGGNGHETPSTRAAIGAGPAPHKQIARTTISTARHPAPHAVHQVDKRMPDVAQIPFDS